MNNNALKAFARHAAEGKVEGGDFEALCKSENLTEFKLFDALASLIAHGYVVTTWSFDDADAAMNRLWGFLTDTVKGDGWDYPKYFYSVYEAFDAGEFHHLAIQKALIQRRNTQSR